MYDKSLGGNKEGQNVNRTRDTIYVEFHRGKATESVGATHNPPRVGRVKTCETNFESKTCENRKNETK